MSKDKFEWDDDKVIEAIEYWAEHANYVTHRGAMLEIKRKQPKEPERIRVDFDTLNMPRRNNRFEHIFVTTEPLGEKFPAIKAAIEQVLNGGNETFNGFYKVFLSKENYNRVCSGGIYVEKDLENAFNAARKTKGNLIDGNISMLYDHAKDYLNTIKP